MPEKGMVTKQHTTFEGLFLPPTSLKILAIAKAIPAFFCLVQEKNSYPKK